MISRAPDAPWVAVGDSVVALHLPSARYHFLNPRAAMAWHLLAEPMSEEQVRQCFADKAPAAADGIADHSAEADSFLADGLESGLLLRGQPAPAAERLVPPTPRRMGRDCFRHGKAALSILLARFQLRFRRFSAIHGAMAGGYYRPGRWLGDAADAARLRRALAAFLAVESFFPPPANDRDCLPRSLALFRTLRWLGFPARHFLGVRGNPLLIHAWVECGGAIVPGGDRPGEFAVLVSSG